MNRGYRFFMILVLGLFSPVTLGASESDFASDIKKLYNFTPHTLNDLQISTKSKELDRFWETVKQDPQKYLPLLRKELIRESNPSFFYYDGSKLLLSLSTLETDRKTALQAIPRIDLRDVQHTDYLRTVHRLAAEGYDTSLAAFRILSYPEFQAFIPQHALTLGQDYGLIYMLLPTKETFYANKAVSKMKEEKDPVALKSLLKLLWYLDTEAADEAIKWASTATHLPKEVQNVAGNAAEARKKIREELSVINKTKLWTLARVAPTSSYESLKRTRSERMRRISDEALIELDQITILMKAKER